MGRYYFGFTQWSPLIDETIPNKPVVAGPRSTWVQFGRWQYRVNGYSAPVVAGGLSVLVLLLLVVASGVLIRRQRGSSGE